MKEKFKLRPKMAFFALSFVFALVFSAWSVNFSFTQLKSAMVFPIPSARAQTTSLYITNIHLSSLTSTSVTIVWDTNLLADSTVRIGTDTNYNDFTCDTCHQADYVKTHRVSIGGLKANTTYHYQVVSKTDKGEEKTSVDRPFVTPGGSADKDAPFITFIRVGANDTDADVEIYTSEEAHVAIAYGATSSPNFDAYLPLENRANDNAGPYIVVHTLHLPPATALALVPGATYFYRVQAFDEAGNSSQSGEFSFVTSSGGDRVFTTGQCDGNIPIGECSPTGLYCDVGTATLVSNCEHCGFICASGQTCQPGGVCSQDPGLTGDPYQCNRVDCYRSCASNSAVSCVTDADCPVCVGGPNDGQACAVDSDCQPGTCSGQARCEDDGLFNSPALAGCYGTYPRCDANVILKVKKDRECAKWLTCNTGIEQKDPKTNQTEELCLNLTACTSLNKSNQCSSYVDLPQEEMTYRTPDEINQLKWLSGSVIAGLDWQYQAGSPLVRGYYPWSAMTEVGEKVRIKNYDFEDTSYNYDIKKWTNFTKYPNVATNPTTIEIVEDPAAKDKKSNYVLKIGDMDSLNQGVRVQASGDTSVSSKYAVNLKIKSENSDPQKVRFSLNSGGNNPKVSVLGTYTLTSGWQYITTPAAPGVGGAYTYLDIYAVEGSAQPFYVDEIKIEPVLQVGAGVFLNRSCRLYPQEDAPSCEYYDSNGIYQRGWRGYCLQRDPDNESLCLSWWPVDILYGESNLFGAEETAGYSGRTPLYYCAESLGVLGAQKPQVYCQDIPANGTVWQSWSGGNYYCASDNSNEECHENCDLNGSAFCYGVHDGSHMIKYFIYGDGSPAQCGHLRYYTASTPGKDYSKYLLKDNTIKVTASYTFDHSSNANGAFEFNAANNWSGWVSEGTCSAENKQLLLSQDWADPNSLANSCGRGINGICCPNSFNFAGGIQLQFNSIGGFDKAVMIMKDDNDLLGGNAVFYISRLTFYPKEFCTKLVEVVTEGGENAAWAGKINSSGYKVPQLNYSLTTDFTPYGGAVTEGGDPAVWPTLSAEEADTYNFPESPFQVRAGKSYACVGDCSKRICWGGGNKDGVACLNNIDCLGQYPDTTVAQGVCIGVGSCARKNPAGAAVSCVMDSDCVQNTSPPVDFGPCAGGAGSYRGSQTINMWPYLNTTLPIWWCLNPTTLGDETALTSQAACEGAGYVWNNRKRYYCFDRLHGKDLLRITKASCEAVDAYHVWTNEPAELFAELNIRALFTRSYGIYEWQTSGPFVNTYQLVSGSNAELQERFVPVWGPPVTVCPSSVRPAYDPLNENTFCAYAPVVKNIKLGDGSSTTVRLGRDGGKVRLSFNSRVDTEQQPLRTIWIDWGDGARDSPAAGYKSKDDPNNPHIFTHTYNGTNCHNSEGCTYNIHILLEDNWGWCSANPKRGTMYDSVCHNGNKNPAYLEGAGSNEGGWCNPAGNLNCIGGTCPLIYDGIDNAFTCANNLIQNWAPVDTCRPIYNSAGGVAVSASCSDGVCSGGMDNGRPCGQLIVELK
ncbi:MAG: fibronectin type III domain-containing protein [Patescibacteria group bacterium]